MEQHRGNFSFEELDLKFVLNECKNESVDSFAYFQDNIVPRYSNKSEFYHRFNISHNEKVGVIVCLCIIGLFGFTFNLVQLVCIIKRIRAKKKLVMDYFLISLTIGDLYKSGPTVPIMATLCYKEFNWAMFDSKYSDVMCKMYTFSGSVARTIGLSSMCIIAVARLFAIRWPMVVKKIGMTSAMTSLLQAAIVWVLVIVICAPMIFFSNTDIWALTPNETILREHPGYYSPIYVDDSNMLNSCVKHTKFCTFAWHGINGTFAKEAFWWLTVILFIVVPQAVLITSYTLIVYTLVMRRRQRKLTFTSMDSSFMAFMNKQDREAITSAVLGSVYGILSLPMLVYIITQPRTISPIENLDPLFLAVSFFDFVTVVTNPLIYTFVTPSFVRREKIFCKRISSILSSRSKDKFTSEEKTDTDLRNELCLLTK